MIYFNELKEKLLKLFPPIATPNESDYSPRVKRFKWKFKANGGYGEVELLGDSVHPRSWNAEFTSPNRRDIVRTYTAINEGEYKTSVSSWGDFKYLHTLSGLKDWVFHYNHPHGDNISYYVMDGYEYWKHIDKIREELDTRDWSA